MNQSRFFFFFTTPFCLQLIRQTGCEVMALTLIQTEDEKYDRLEKQQKLVSHFITTGSDKNLLPPFWRRSARLAVVRKVSKLSCKKPPVHLVIKKNNMNEHYHHRHMRALYNSNSITFSQPLLQESHIVLQLVFMLLFVLVSHSKVTAIKWKLCQKAT